MMRLLRCRVRARAVGPEWRPEWNALARFNSQRADGVVHTPEHVERMAELQRSYDEEHRRAYIAAGGVEVPGGEGFLVPVAPS
jgi:hypothetical protein